MKLSKLTKLELDAIINNANFTEEEIEVFKLLARGKTITEIAQQVSVCNRTVNRRIERIKSKISRLEG
nr:MAG TPA: response regulator [Bacteriophage sp.]